MYISSKDERLKRIATYILAASAYALEQTDYHHRYQFSRSRISLQVCLLVHISQKTDCKVKRKKVERMPVARVKERERRGEERQRIGQSGISFPSFLAHRKIGQTQSACNDGLLRCISRKLKKRSARNGENKRDVLMSSKKGSA